MSKIYMMTAVELTPTAVEFIRKNYPERYKKSLGYKEKSDADLCLCTAVLLDKAGIPIEKNTVFYQKGSLSFYMTIRKINHSSFTMN